MNAKPSVVKQSPGRRARGASVGRRRLPGAAGRAGANRRCARPAMHGRWTSGTLEEWGTTSPCAGGDHEIDPAFDEVGDLGSQVDALFAFRRCAGAWDSLSDDDRRDVE